LRDGYAAHERQRRRRADAEERGVRGRSFDEHRAVGKREWAAAFESEVGQQFVPHEDRVADARGPAKRAADARVHDRVEAPARERARYGDGGFDGTDAACEDLDVRALRNVT